MGFDLLSIGYADDTGLGPFLRRDGQAEKYFRNFDAMFYDPLCFKSSMGFVRL